MDIVALAQTIATEAHKLQTRKQMKKEPNAKMPLPVPYIEHPKAVMRLVYDTILLHHNRNVKEHKDQRSMIPSGYMYEDNRFTVYLATAWLHDVLEDTKVTRKDLVVKYYEAMVEESKHEFQNTVEYEMSQLQQWYDTIEAVELLTKEKHGGYSYVKYLEAVKANKISRLVKLADLTHNMSDLDNTSSLYEKYDLTREYLRSVKP